MNRNEIKSLLMVVLGQVDYDIMKSYDPKTAEEPEQAKEEMEKLIDIVEDHLKISERIKNKRVLKKNPK